MKNSKKTLKMLIICIVGILVVALVNTFKKEGDPYENGQTITYQTIEKENLLNSSEYKSYYIFFYK